MLVRPRRRIGVPNAFTVCVRSSGLIRGRGHRWRRRVQSISGRDSCIRVIFRPGQAQKKWRPEWPFGSNVSRQEQTGDRKSCFCYLQSDPGSCWRGCYGHDTSGSRRGSDPRGAAPVQRVAVETDNFRVATIRSEPLRRDFRASGVRRQPDSVCLATRKLRAMVRPLCSFCGRMRQCRV